jgi:hypothetical protein
MRKIKQFVKKILPNSLLEWNKKRKSAKLRIKNSSMSTQGQPPFNIRNMRTVLEVSASRWLAHEGETIKTVLLYPA